MSIVSYHKVLREARKFPLQAQVELKESKELDKILEESDHLALLKSKAEYTLFKSKNTNEASI